MTIRKLNNMIYGFNGYEKEDNDFTAMIHTLHNAGMMLMDGEIEYNSDMTNKHYKYRLAETIIDEYDQVVDGKTIGYLSAYKCFVNGIEKPYEILAYVS